MSSGTEAQQLKMVPVTVDFLQKMDLQNQRSAKQPGKYVNLIVRQFILESAFTSWLLKNIANNFNIIGQECITPTSIFLKLILGHSMHFDIVEYIFRNGNVYLHCFSLTKHFRHKLPIVVNYFKK